MKLDELKQYKKILILGYGVEGQATEKYLQKFYPEAEIGRADKMDGEDYLQRQNDYDLVIKTPGIPPRLVTKPYTTATNIFFANVTNQIIGITGTKGKSTVSNLVNSVLNGAGQPATLAGNIGRPMLELLTEGLDEKAIVVLELSSYQLEDIQFSQHIACILNIYQELHNHQTLENYFQAKAQIVHHSLENDYYVYNQSFVPLHNLTKKTKAQATAYSEKDEEPIGAIYRSNVAAVAAITSLYGINREVVREIIAQTPQLPHRLVNMGTYEGITFYDDSASTHPEATVHALSLIPNVSTAIIGGQNRGYDFSVLVKKLASVHVDNIVLFPDTDNVINKLVAESGNYQPQVLVTKSMVEAVAFAFSKSRRGSVCLLSPGAPSYTMFTNFSERGDTFTKLVNTHEKETASSKTATAK